MTGSYTGMHTRAQGTQQDFVRMQIPCDMPLGRLLDLALKQFGFPSLEEQERTHDMVGDFQFKDVPIFAHDTCLTARISEGDMIDLVLY